MKKFYYFFLVLVVVLTTACDDIGTPVKKEIFNGYAQKGPFINGSSVTITELDSRLNQTGKTYHTTIADNSGSFEQKNIELISNVVELKADGYYFNEITNETSASTLTLYALTDIRDIYSANVNVLTHLEKARAEYLVQNKGKRFSVAKKQAQREVFAIFGFDSENGLSEELNITNNAKLLAISCILQGYLSTGDMMQLMADIITDIRTDGTLNNTALGTKLMNNASAISNSLVKIRSNIEAKYAELGINITIPNFESYIISFLNNGMYSQTSGIIYPATGLYGQNILSDEFTRLDKPYVSNNVCGSMRAEVPKGLSLKIVIRGQGWGTEGGPNSPINWIVSPYNNATQSGEFTVTESGKFSDLVFVRFGNNPIAITIEFYENGATTPTKIKQINL